MTRKVKPLIFLEQLEPRILLSGDSLLNIAPNPDQDTVLENMPQVVEYTELLHINEQYEGQISQESIPSNTINTDVYKPVFTLFIDDENINNESTNTDLGADNIGSAQIGEVLAVFPNDYNGDMESKVGTSEDGSMLTYTNDADLSIEYATSIEIRGPPAGAEDYAIASNISNYATSDGFAETSDVEGTQQLQAPELPGLQLVNPDISSWDGQIVYLDFDGEESVALSPTSPMVMSNRPSSEAGSTRFRLPYRRL